MGKQYIVIMSCLCAVAVPVALQQIPTKDACRESNRATGATASGSSDRYTRIECLEREFSARTMQRGKYWVLQNYVRATHQPSCDETVTYTTHGSYTFLDNVPPVVERWLGPISLAIYAPGADFDPTVNSIRYLRDCLKSSNLIKNYVSFHIYFSHEHIPSKIQKSEKFLSTPYNCSLKPPYVVNSSTTYLKQKGIYYPINVGRNIARDSALTHYIFPADIELYPSPKLIPLFIDMLARNGKHLNTSTNPRVFVISIFEVQPKSKVPENKTELRAMLANKTAIPFHKSVCASCHSIPGGQEWMDAEETKQMDVFHVGKRQGQFGHWEPFFIGTQGDPNYDERLSWDGQKDKMSQGYILCVMDYDFMILNNAFLIHKPGIKSMVKDPKKEVLKHRQDNLIEKDILPELKILYGTRSGCRI